MGFKQSTATSTARSTTRSITSSKAFSGDLFSDVISGCLAGFGIWTKPSPSASPSASLTAKSDLVPPSPVKASNIYPLRVVRVKDSNPQMAGRMVISGCMADVCAELDRLAA